MAEGNGSKVAIGCCSAVAVMVVVLVIVGVVMGRKTFTWFKTAAQKQETIVANLDDWKSALAMSGGDPRAVSPGEIGSFERTRQSTDAAAPGFDVGKTGMLDEYSSGPTAVKVWIVRATHSEAEAIIERIKEQVDSRFSSKSTSSFFVDGSGRFTYSGSPPEERGLLVHDNDWLILMQSNDKAADLQGFLIDYADAAGRMAAASSEIDDATEAEVAPLPEATAQ